MAKTYLFANIFKLKIMVKSGLTLVGAAQCKKKNLSWKAEMTWQQVFLKGLVEIQNKKKSYTTFHHQFKNVGFKTWDFSPLILGVLGGV